MFGKAAAVSVAVLASVGGVGEAMATERLKYEVTRSFSDFEVRRYAPYLVAQTEVSGDRQEAGNQGFRILADYIFGNNRGAKKVAMTAPVAQTESKPEAVKIAMTAPVAQTASGANRYSVQFSMPSEYALADLPQPNDDRVVLREVQARRVAALRYSGTWSESRYQEHLEKLRGALTREGLVAVGEPTWARYDPPFKPWFLRTNEILVELAP